MSYGTQKGKRKKTRKVNHMNHTQLQEALSDMKHHKESKYYQHILTRFKAPSPW